MIHAGSHGPEGRDKTRSLVILCVNLEGGGAWQPINDDRMESINRDSGEPQYHYRKEILN